MLESLYYGKAILGFPISADQPGGCYRAERMGLGISLQYGPTSEFVVESMLTVLNPHSPYQQNIQRVQKMIEFKELRSGRDLAYYVRRQAKITSWGGHSS